ncbi:heparan-alpha-glucosaminide N-acetyltransferase domain-containing protein [Georgenia sp. TF02-10]|nr:heparan-alpha-glucosaminide N-acetyltransferase domain-containing protein [Georgenia sp. TF02-10]
MRGVMLIASVSVNSLWAAPEWFEHAPWDGVHPLDLIFPVFVTLTGCGLAFAMHRRINVRPLVRRVLVLLLVGLLYNAVTVNAWDPATWRFSGVLQLYAVVVAVMTLGHLLTRSWRGWALLTAASAGAHTLLLATWARGCPGGALTLECNPSGALDTALLTPAHMYAGGLLGHDPEGVVAISGALVSAAAGATVGHLLLSLRSRQTPERPWRGGAVATVSLGALGVGLVGAALLLVQLPAWLGGSPLPVMKRLWTAPFALEVAAGVVLALLVAHLLLDRPALPRPLRAVSWPLIALGRNSLLVYFGSHVVMALLMRPPAPGEPGLAEQLGHDIAIAGHPQVTWTVLAVLAWMALACLLHQRRIYLRP